MARIRQHRALFVSIMVSAVSLGGGASALAADHLVKDQAAYKQALKNAQPGDKIVLANGEWKDFQIVFEATGTEDAPITLMAEKPGGVFITGESNLRIGGEHLVVWGLTFRDGYSPTSEVVSFRRDSDTLANNVRFVENVIDGFNKIDRSEQDSWVVLYGQNNRVDQNAFLGKTNKGPTLIVRLSTEASQTNNHKIERNFFGGRPPLGGNGGETLRIGVSQTSRTNSGTVVRENYFERCDGEVEIISIKSQNNLVTENVFYESRGSVVFRHGGQNEVSRNVFLGNGVPDTGGVRVINDNQVIKENYLEGLRGIKFLGALVVMNGVPNSPENRYHQVDGAVIENNSLIDVAHIGLGVGSDEERSAAPINSVVSENIFFSDDADPVGIFDDISGITFKDNVSNNAGFEKIGVETISDFTMERGENGLAYVSGSTVGAPRDLAPIGRDETGPRFYKKAPQTAPDGVKTEVKARDAALRDAISAANDGDVIVLPAKSLSLSSPIVIDKKIAIVGSGEPEGRRQTVIKSSKAGAFELAAGGELKVKNVDLVQNSSTHAVFRATGENYTGAYQLKLMDVHATAGKRLKSAAPLLAAEDATFAKSIVMKGVSVKSWPGAVFQLSGKDLDGWYLTDLLSIKDSKFVDVDGPLVSFGREGRDESTFGPRFSLTGSKLVNVGQSDTAIMLSGIDGLKVKGNKFNGSGAIDIKRRVLGFPFMVSKNMHDDSSVLVVKGVNDEPLDFQLSAGDE